MSAALIFARSGKSRSSSSTALPPPRPGRRTAPRIRIHARGRARPRRAAGWSPPARRGPCTPPPWWASSAGSSARRVAATSRPARRPASAWPGRSARTRAIAAGRLRGLDLRAGPCVGWPDQLHRHAVRAEPPGQLDHLRGAPVQGQVPDIHHPPAVVRRGQCRVPLPRAPEHRRPSVRPGEPEPAAQRRGQHPPGQQQRPDRVGGRVPPADRGGEREGARRRMPAGRGHRRRMVAGRGEQKGCDARTRHARARRAAELHEGGPGDPRPGRAGRRPALVHTGQHYDERMSEVFFRQLGLPRAGRQPRGRLGHATREQTAAVMIGLEEVFARAFGPALVVVVRRRELDRRPRRWSPPSCGIPVAHVEAGLRSFDRTMPEEINRRRHRPALPTCCSRPAPDAVGHLAQRGRRARTGSTSSATR